jgi:hypothetical protein
VWNMAASLVQGSSLAHIARADSSMIGHPVRSPPANIAKADRTTRCADADIFRPRASHRCDPGGGQVRLIR